MGCCDGHRTKGQLGGVHDRVQWLDHLGLCLVVWVGVRRLLGCNVEVPLSLGGVGLKETVRGDRLRVVDSPVLNPCLVYLFRASNAILSSNNSPRFGCQKIGSTLIRNNNKKKKAKTWPPNESCKVFQDSSTWRQSRWRSQSLWWVSWIRICNSGVVKSMSCRLPILIRRPASLLVRTNRTWVHRRPEWNTRTFMIRAVCCDFQSAPKIKLHISCGRVPWKWDMLPFWRDYRATFTPVLLEIRKLFPKLTYSAA